MKKTYIYGTAIAIASLLASALPFVGNAQGPAPTPVQVRLQQNAENNRDIRNEQMRKPPLVRALKLASSTPPAWIAKLPPAMARTASSTAGFKEREKWKEARIDHFAQFQKNLIARGEHSLNQLKELREKISARIGTAEQKGRDMTKAKGLLVIADAKIVAAEQAIAAISAYVPPIVASSDTALNASSTVTLEKPRVLGKSAIDAVNEAREALKDVVRAIAHAMGLKAGQNKEAQIETAATATTTP